MYLLLIFTINGTSSVLFIIEYFNYLHQLKEKIGALSNDSNVIYDAFHNKYDSPTTL